MARHVLDETEQKSSRSRSSSRSQPAKPTTQPVADVHEAPVKQQQPRKTQPPRFQKIQNDPYAAEIQRATQSAPDAKNDTDSDPYEALGESASRVHYFQQADRALAEAEGGTYSPERAEQEYAADEDASEARALRGDEASVEMAGALSEDMAQKLADKLIPHQSEAPSQPNAQKTSRQTARKNADASAKPAKQRSQAPSIQAQTERQAEPTQKQVSQVKVIKKLSQTRKQAQRPSKSA